MYPNLEDVRQALPKQFPNTPSPESIWEDAVFARSILFEAKQACWNHGRHSQTPAGELLRFVEQVIGHGISPWAFVASLRLLGMKTNPQTANPNELANTRINFPPVGGFPVERWRKVYVRDLNQEIEEEKFRMARFAQ